MNKITKGAVVGGIGVALLLGGGSTLAYWTDQAQVTGATITSGDLDIVSVAAGTWTVAHNGGSSEPVTNITTFKMVPGDTLTYTVNATVTLVGDNLTANITAAPAAGAITGDAALVGRLNVTTTVNNGTTTPLAPGASQVIPVAVTIAWPLNEGPDSPSLDNPAKNQQVSFADFAVTLTQVH